MTTRAALLEPLRHETDRLRFMGRLREAAEAAIDVVAPQSALTVGDKGDFHVVAEDLAIDSQPTRGAFRDVAERLRIPLPFLDRLTQEHPDLAAININMLADRDTRTALYRLWQAEDGWVLRAVLSDRYETYDNFTILQALARGMDDAGQSLAESNVEIDLTPSRLRMRLTVPGIELAIPDLLEGYRFPFDTSRTDGNHHPAPAGHVPPVMWAGLEIANSETGDGAFTIVPRAEVLICRNGLTRTVDAVRAVHLGGRLETGVVQWSPETRRLNVELLASKVADATRQFVSVDYLRRLADEARAAKGVAVTRPSETITKVQAAHGLSEAETQAVMDAFLLGGDATVFGVAQAVTAAAQTVPDGDRQAEMEAMFWQIVAHPATVPA